METEAQKTKARRAAMMRSEGERLSDEEEGGAGGGIDGGMVTARGSPPYGGAGGGKKEAMAEVRPAGGGRWRVCLRLGSCLLCRAFYGFWNACRGRTEGRRYCRRR
jgi:hypothetical protein